MKLSLLITGVAAAAAMAGAAQAGITVTYEAPGVTNTTALFDVLGKETCREVEVVDVVGSLCENNDKFAIQRTLAKIIDGDILIIQDTGAHGIAMGFNYNGNLRPKELLLTAGGKVELIRRAETIEDYFVTLSFSEDEIIL